jgi:phage-related protein
MNAALERLVWHRAKSLCEYCQPIGPRCHELRVRDGAHNWRLIYRIDATSIVIAEVFSKTSRKTPQVVIDQCKSRLRRYDESDQ